MSQYTDVLNEYFALKPGKRFEWTLDYDVSLPYDFDYPNDFSVSIYKLAITSTTSEIAQPELLALLVKNSSYVIFEGYYKGFDLSIFEGHDGLILHPTIAPPIENMNLIPDNFFYKIKCSQEYFDDLLPLALRSPNTIFCLYVHEVFDIRKAAQVKQLWIYVDIEDQREIINLGLCMNSSSRVYIVILSMDKLTINPEMLLAFGKSLTKIKCQFSMENIRALLPCAFRAESYLNIIFEEKDEDDNIQLQDCKVYIIHLLRNIYVNLGTKNYYDEIGRYISIINERKKQIQLDARFKKTKRAKLD